MADTKTVLKWRVEDGVILAGGGWGRTSESGLLMGAYTVANWCAGGGARWVWDYLLLPEW